MPLRLVDVRARRRYWHLAAVIGLLLPETIILGNLHKPLLIGIFIGVVGTGIVLVGCLFNLLFWREATR